MRFLALVLLYNWYRPDLLLVSSCFRPGFDMGSSAVALVSSCSVLLCFSPDLARA